MEIKEDQEEAQDESKQSIVQQPLTLEAIQKNISTAKLHIIFSDYLRVIFNPYVIRENQKFVETNIFPIIQKRINNNTFWSSKYHCLLGDWYGLTDEKELQIESYKVALEYLQRIPYSKDREKENEIRATEEFLLSILQSLERVPQNTKQSLLEPQATKKKVRSKKSLAKETPKPSVPLQQIQQPIMEIGKSRAAYWGKARRVEIKHVSCEEYSIEIPKILKAVIDVFKNHVFLKHCSIYIRGGFPRSSLYNALKMKANVEFTPRKIKDLDLVTNASPEEVLEVFLSIDEFKARVKLIPGANKHVVIKGEIDIEIGPFHRLDASSDIRSDNANMLDDLLVCDITQNACYINLKSEKKKISYAVSDTFNTLEHIEKDILCIPFLHEGDVPRASVVFRLIRFMSIFNEATLENMTRDAIKNNLNLIISQTPPGLMHTMLKRLWLEGLAIANFKNMEKFTADLNNMETFNLVDAIFPSLKNNKESFCELLSHIDNQFKFANVSPQEIEILRNKLIIIIFAALIWIAEIKDQTYDNHIDMFKLLLDGMEKFANHCYLPKTEDMTIQSYWIKCDKKSIPSFIKSLMKEVDVLFNEVKEIKVSDKGLFSKTGKNGAPSIKEPENKQSKASEVKKTINPVRMDK